jgi:hypothetical protein
MMFPNKDIAGGDGWFCTCGAWVRNGVTHACSTGIYPGIKPSIENEQLKRIADALEKLIELLEKNVA